MLRVSGERRPRAQSPLETAEEGSPWRGDGRRAQGALFLTISGVFIGGSILWAVFPRRLRFDPPGARIADGDQPRLLQLIREESEAAGEDPSTPTVRGSTPTGRRPP